MTLFELKKGLLAKTPAPLYIFTGDELALMDIYIDKIAQTHHNAVRRIDGIAQIFSRLKNHSFLNKTHCYIVRDDPDFMDQPEIWEEMRSGASLGGHNVIMIYSQIDKRSKFYKANQDIIVEFDFMEEEILRQMVMKQTGLDQRRASIFCGICERNYGRILLEIDKIQAFIRILKIPFAEGFDRALALGMIYQPPDNQIFELVDLICKRNIERSFAGIRDFQLSNDSPLGLISLLYNNFRQQLLVQSAGSGDITQRTGLTPWQIKLARDKAGHYSIGELVKILRTIRETERGIKIGEVDAKWALDHLLIQIL